MHIFEWIVLKIVFIYDLYIEKEKTFTLQKTRYLFIKIKSDLLEVYIRI